ncbi:hypothetical protein MRB53_038323 [Persea americana]|nr:hypothetical protein MRB53_038323 [Persea americana]
MVNSAPSEGCVKQLDASNGDASTKLRSKTCLSLILIVIACSTISNIPNPSNIVPVSGHFPSFSIEHLQNIIQPNTALLAFTKVHIIYASEQLALALETLLEVQRASLDRLEQNASQ